jgi:hypothetical protein
MPTEAASAVTGTLRSASPGFSAQTTLGVGQMHLAAAGHHEQPRGGHVNSTRTGTAGRVPPVTTCTVNNVSTVEKKMILRFFAPLLYSLITVVVNLGRTRSSWLHSIVVVRSTE